MSKILLLADSNFVNNIGAYKGRRIKNLEVKSCQSRLAVMSELAAVEEGIVVLSCWDMIAADIVRSTENGSGSAIEFHFNRIFLKMAEKVDESDGKLAYGIAAPLFWSSLPEEVKRDMNHAFKMMKKTPVSNVWCSSYFKDVKAGADGTHLTKLSASKFIGHIHDFFAHISSASGLGLVEFEEPENQAQNATTDWAEDTSGVDHDAVSALEPPEDIAPPSPARTSSMLSASMLLPMRSQSELGRAADVETQARLMRLAAPQPDLTIPPPSTGIAAQAFRNFGQMSAGSFSQMSGGEHLAIDRRLRALEAQSFYNNLMTAALKEEQDTLANKAMLNRLTVAGVIIEGIQDMADSEKVPAMKAKITEIFNSIKGPDQVFEIQFVKHLNKQIRGQRSSVIEVKLADEKQTREMRAKFVEKYKSLPEKINITPVVRMSTRVRIEILHSVCFYMKRQDSSIVQANCLHIVPKPVVKVTRKTMSGSEVTTTMTFIDCCNWVKENGLIGRMDLSKARERAGSSARGMLAQHFVLLD